ncbi:MAG: cytochrome P460 family protein [Alphaproteobacteria bacterium]
MAAYDCVKPELKAGYAKSGLAVARDYQGWAKYNTVPYESGTHGSRYVNNYANATAKNYGKFEESGTMPEGSFLAKDSILADEAGKVRLGPLFLMEKMEAGFNGDTFDWRYTMVMPDGAIVGTTNGDGHNNVQFCVDCHNLQEQQDAMWFLPEEFRQN